MTDKQSFDLIQKIPDTLCKKIVFQGKEIFIKDLMQIIYKYYYENKCLPITSADIVKELKEKEKKEKKLNNEEFDEKSYDTKKFGKFGNKVMNVHLCHSDSTKNLICRVNSDQGKTYLFYPLALVLRTESNIYDFTSTSNPLYENTHELPSLFKANLKEISENLKLNICPSITLKEFLEHYREDKEYHEDILEILIYLATSKKVDTYKNPIYSSVEGLRNDVSPLLKQRNSPLPDYSEEKKLLVTKNRANELNDALKYLENYNILLISGVGGVGKSTLARALVDRRPETVPRPFWFDFDNNQDAKLGDILEKLASYLNATDIKEFKDKKREPNETDVNKLIGELQVRKEVWLIFDDLSTVISKDQHFADEGIKLLFSSLTKEEHNAKVIVTSRILPKLKKGDSFLDINRGDKKYHLGGLSINFAVDYLASNGLDKMEPEKLEELATGVDGHPFALELLVELVKEFGMKDTLKDLSMYQESKDDTIKKARKLFDKLAGEEKELLERISVYRGPVGLEEIKEMFTENTTKNAVKKLIDKSLLETDHNGNYWLHPLVREFSYEDLKNKKEAHKIACDYYNNIDLPENPIKKEELQPAIEAHYHACEAG